MRALFVTSLEAAAGKTALVAGLGLRLMQDGFRIGYLKPLTLAKDGMPADEKEASFLRSIFQLEETLEELSPLPLDTGQLNSLIWGEGGWFKERLSNSLQRLSQGKDLLFLEALNPPYEGSPWGVAASTIVESLGAKALLVLGYGRSIPWEGVEAAKQTFGESFLGVVINAVPPSEAQVLERNLHQVGVKPLGILPEERRLLTFSIGDLAEHLEAQVLTAPHRTEILVESLMAGGMSVDSGLAYFSRRKGKAVVLPYNRPDLQMAALETSLRCFLLTGGGPPHPTVLYRCQEEEVPILLVKEETPTVLERMEALFKETRFHHRDKLETLDQMLRRHFDFPRFYHGLGLNKAIDKD